MKAFISIIFLLVISCSQKRQNASVTVKPTNDTFFEPGAILKDTIHFHDTVCLDKMHDTIKVYALKSKKEDSLVIVVRDLKSKLFVAKYDIERVRYYLKICQRNPKQVKFLVSWINRAIN